jgi:hypothetical protein
MLLALMQYPIVQTEKQGAYFIMGRADVPA